MRVAVDVLVWREDSAILFIERKCEPHKDALALPGGFVEEDETCTQAAIRELKEETGIEVSASNLRVIGVYDDPKRDPRGRVVSVAFFVTVLEGTEAVAGDDAAKARFYMSEEFEQLGKPFAFDHARIVYDAMGVFE